MPMNTSNLANFFVVLSLGVLLELLALQLHALLYDVFFLGGEFTAKNARFLHSSYRVGIVHDVLKLWRLLLEHFLPLRPLLFLPLPKECMAERATFASVCSYFRLWLSG